MPRNPRDRRRPPQGPGPVSGGPREGFQPTNPRGRPPESGVRIGQQSLFVAGQDMPRLRVENVAYAADNIVRGVDCYASLVYLSRARADDFETVFAASQSPEIRVRWERLWVLSPFFCRLVRLQEGRDRAVACMQDDLAAVHLLSKFVEQNNHSVVRMFKRLYQPLLAVLCTRLAEYRDDPRRTSLLAAIIATIETDGDALLKVLTTQVGETAAPGLMSLLFVRYKDPGQRKLSSAVLREKLETWGGP